MATKRTRRARHLRLGLSEYQVASLLGTDLPEPTDADDWWRICEEGRDDLHQAPTFPTSAHALWRANRDALMELFLADHPGQRPSAWWKFDAPRQPMGSFPGWHIDGKLPELRQRVGGIGSLRYDFLNEYPVFESGIPYRWLTAKDFETWPTLHDDGAVPYDLADPPLYEAEASYLERRGLLLPGERQRLTKADFEPEPVIVDVGAAA